MILNKGLGGPWSLSVCFGKEKGLLPPLGFEPQFFSIIAHSVLVDDVWLLHNQTDAFFSVSGNTNILVIFLIIWLYDSAVLC